MKHLLLSALLLAGLAAHGQAPTSSQRKETGVYYELIEDARGFSSAKDTANATPSILLTKGTQVYLIDNFTSRWSHCIQPSSSTLYLIPKTALSAMPVAKEATSASGTTGYDTGGAIYTGPRGGQYRINSKGNKVYIKRK